MAYPTPVTKTDEFLLAIVLKLEEIRCCVIDVETQLEKLSTSPTATTEITSTPVDAKAIAQIVTTELKKSFKAKP